MKRKVFILTFLRRLKYILRDTIRGLRRHKAMGFASVFSVLSLLLILGSTFLALLNLDTFIIDTNDKIGIIDIFILDNISVIDQRAIDDLIKKDPNIEEYEYFTKEQAFEIFSESWEQEAYLLEGMVDAFQPYYTVKLKDINASHDYVKDMERVKGIDSINYYQDLIDKIESMSEKVRYSGLTIILAFGVISLLVISNTIKLTVSAREREIEVMRYVGANSYMIEGPFLLEGLIFGLTGAILAFVILYFAYNKVYLLYDNWFETITSGNLINPMEIRNKLSIVFLSLGGGIGVIASLFSLHRYKKI